METANYIETKGGGLSTSDKLVIALREEANKNPVFNTICRVLASRYRTRQQITMQALKATMKKQGLEFTKQQYEDVLKFMARVGIGHLDKGPRGRIRALKGIKVTLQSVGKAALAGQDQLNNFKSQVKFAKVPQTFQAKAIKSDSNYKVVFTIEMDSKSMKFEVPGGIKPNELGDFLARTLKGQ